jgi:predicted CXXCH cytochrome family protein
MPSDAVGPLVASGALFGACVVAVAAATACGPSAPVPAARAPAASPGGGRVRSNVTRGDYAGSGACAACHPDIVDAWGRSPMHRMTREARPADVRAPFDGTRWRFKDDAVVLERRGDDRFIRVESGEEGRVRSAKSYRVTRIVGGRTREDYVGVDEAAGGDEVVLPVSFVFATASLRYKGYSVMVHERASLRAGPVWSQTCIFCHNTAPELDRLLGAIAGKGHHPYQALQVDVWLPADRRERLRVVDDAGFARAVDDEVTRLGGSAAGAAHERPGPLARRAIDAVRTGFDAGALVEVGIGCEACHGGAREHVNDPRVLPSFAPTAPWLAIDPEPDGGADSPRPHPKTRDARAVGINRVCARCHQVLFSRYPYTWEGGRRDANAGGSHINSGEARDFLLGGCALSLACTRCHDPHGGSDRDALRTLATPAGNGVCTACHADLAPAAALRAHAHHDPAGEGGACIACHMPRKNMGLDGKLTRYHRIGSPTDAARVLGDRPLECALCHSDRSVGDLVLAMEKWWPVRYPRQRLEALYGSLGANVLRATLERGKAHEQAVAIGVLSEAGARDAAPLVARQLANEYPLVREWARRALDAMGAPAQPPPGGAPLPAPIDEEPED